MPDTVADRVLYRAFVVLVLIALTTLLYTELWRKTPAPFEFQLEALTVPGYRLKLDGTDPELPGDRHSFGRLSSWAADSTGADEPAFRLQLITVHSRTEDDAELEAMAAHPRLPKLDERRLLDGSRERSKPDIASIGRAGEHMVLQSCIVPGSGAYATREDLLNAIRAQRIESWDRRLRQIAGLQDNIRWECLLVSISMPRERASDEALLAAWNSVYPAISARLQATSAR